MKRFITKDKLIIGIFIIIIAGYGFWVNSESDDNKINSKDNVNETVETNHEKSRIIYVHIDGEVNKPGLYELTSDKRIDDVVELAGGLTGEAVTGNINLAKKVEDEMKIVIPSKVDIPETSIDTESTNGLVNINTATKEQLMVLSGIGEVKAESIIKYRESTKFSSIEDIMNVNGIGEKLFESIKAEITVN